MCGESHLIAIANLSISPRMAFQDRGGAMRRSCALIGFLALVPFATITPAQEMKEPIVSGQEKKDVLPTVGPIHMACNQTWLKITWFYPLGLAADIVNVLKSVQNYYNCQFNNDVVINISFGYQPLGPNILSTLGEAQRNTIDVSYGSARSKLVSKLAYDQNIQKLNPGMNAISMLTTAGIKAYSSITLTNANAKVLGFIAPKDPAIDSQITLSSNISWSFDNFKGEPNKTSMFTVLVHEVGHVLGFISGVDASESPALLDIYRHSDTSLASGRPGVTWLQDVREPSCGDVKYFFTTPIDTNPGSKDCVVMGGCNKYVEYSRGEERTLRLSGKPLA
jgi:hypothetical protein